MLLSCAPVEGRISGIVDVPNACATLALPLAIFDKVNTLQAVFDCLLQTNSVVSTLSFILLHLLGSLAQSLESL